MNTMLELLECKGINEWSASVFKLARQHGFPSVYFGIKLSRSLSCQSAVVQTNFSTAWRHLYDGCYHEIDPVASHCRRHVHPLLWDAMTFATDRQQEFYEEGCRHGLRSGIGYPVYGPQGQTGILCFASDDPVREDVRIRAYLSLLRDFACESYFNISHAEETEGPVTALTPRELECLKWVAAGKTTWEISRILSCSEATVNFHVYNLTRKFGVQTRAQAVVRAIFEGLIAPL
jgi:LuxR family quorum-sensing transcriptional regulator LasR